MYEAFGLRVRSAIPLPLSPLQDGPAAHVTIRLAAEGECAPKPVGPILAGIACTHGTVQFSRHASERGTLLVSRLAGTILVDPGLRTVTVFPSTVDIDRRVLGLLLASQVAVFLRARFGMPVLHCSAVVTSDGVAVFLGDSGQGKSTTAASFLQERAELLTDDALPIEIRDGQVFGVPGPPIMKLWDASVEHVLDLDHNLPNLLDGIPKKLLRIDRMFRMADRPMPVKAIYLLDRREHGQPASVELTPLHKMEALGVLMRHTSRSLLLIPSEVPTLFATYAKVVQSVEVRRLTYGSSFDRLEYLRAAVRADLGKR